MCVDKLHGCIVGKSPIISPSGGSQCDRLGAVHCMFYTTMMLFSQVVFILQWPFPGARDDRQQDASDRPDSSRQRGADGPLPRNRSTRVPAGRTMALECNL